MKKLLLIVLLVVFGSMQALAAGQPVKVCTNEDEANFGVCYVLKAVSSLAAGMGGAAGMRMLPTSALLYAHDATGKPLVLKVGTGTSANALRVVTASDSPGGSAATPSHVNVQQVGGNTVTTGAGAVAAGTQRMTLASNDPAVASLGVLDDWDESDRAKVNPIAGQAGIAAGSGAIDSLTPRVTLASNDPAVTSLGVVDDWDESDRAKVNIITGQAGVAAGAGAVDALTQRATLASDDPAVASLAKNPWSKADDDETSVCTALTTGSQQYTIPQTGDWYIIKVIGNTAYILGGSNPTATTAANGHVYPISSGEKLVVPISSAKIAFIASTATGEICFLRLNSSL